MGEAGDKEFLNDSVEDVSPTLKKTTCTRSKEYLTKEEEDILADIRALHEEAMATKDRLKVLRVNPNTDASRQLTKLSMDHERLALTDKLNDLRRKRNELDKHREEAHHRKMVTLGHEAP